MLGWKDQNKTVDNSDYVTWKNKPKDIGERMDT